MFEILQATLDQADEISKLEQEVWNEQGVSNLYDVATLIRFGFVYVVLHDGSVIGAIIALMTKCNNIFVQDFVVRKEFRGKGLGEGLYMKLIESTSNDIIALVHDDYISSFKLHESLGFKLEEKIKNAYGSGTYTMNKFVLNRK